MRFRQPASIPTAGDFARGYPKPQTSLGVSWRTGPAVAVHEVANMLWHGCAFDIASGLDFGGNRFRNVVRPMLKCVEGDNTDWIIKLASQKISDDGFEVRPLDLGFAVDSATCAKAVHNEVNGLIGPIGHELR